MAPPTKAELADVAEFEAQWDAAADRAETGAMADVGETGHSTLARRWLRPTCEVVGLASGFAGDGIKTIVPATGLVKVACRLVPGQDPDRVLDLARAHVEGLRVPGANVTYAPLPFRAEPYQAPRDAPANAAAAAVLARMTGQAPLRRLRVAKMQSCRHLHKTVFANSTV